MQSVFYGCRTELATLRQEFVSLDKRCVCASVLPVSWRARVLWCRCRCRCVLEVPGIGNGGVPAPSHRLRQLRCDETFVAAVRVKMAFVADHVVPYVHKLGDQLQNRALEVPSVVTNMEAGTVKQLNAAVTALQEVRATPARGVRHHTNGMAAGGAGAGVGAGAGAGSGSTPTDRIRPSASADGLQNSSQRTRPLSQRRWSSWGRSQQPTGGVNGDGPGGAGAGAAASVVLFAAPRHEKSNDELELAPQPPVEAVSSLAAAVSDAVARRSVAAGSAGAVLACVTFCLNNFPRVSRSVQQATVAKVIHQLAADAPNASIRRRWETLYDVPDLVPTLFDAAVWSPSAVPQGKRVQRGQPTFEDTPSAAATGTQHSGGLAGATGVPSDTEGDIDFGKARAAVLSNSSSQFQQTALALLCMMRVGGCATPAPCCRGSRCAYIGACWYAGTWRHWPSQRWWEQRMRRCLCQVGLQADRSFWATPASCQWTQTHMCLSASQPRQQLQAVVARRCGKRGSVPVGTHRASCEPYHVTTLMVLLVLVLMAGICTHVAEMCCS